ncbi:MAG: hypothetical protein CL824_01375 [Crocinitomicaceae bacterium]|nr:hypothetical protein [Crocinitomicaceae bacterium]
MKNLKNKILKLSVFVLSISVLTSCSKHKEVSEADAVALIESSLEKDTYGVSEMITKYSEQIVDEIASYPCAEYDTSYNFSHVGNIIEANYDINWNYTLNCNMGVPSTIDLEASTAGTYSTNRVNSNDNSLTNLNITGVEPNETSLVFNGNLNRDGNQSFIMGSKIRDVSSSISIIVSDISVNKSSLEIESGTGTVALSVDNGNETFTFNGDIVFNGGGSATLNINGNTYQINL